ncbi:hypothetical protein ONZ45_g14182 [Pleurotus djamor]|nr:hypothetical protein ONZ45_g14182 [Pleurotus djamor]
MDVTDKFSFKPRPKAMDLSHHLSEVSKARMVSPLKSLQRHLDQNGLISMGGGLPNPAFFPFSQLEAEALRADAYPTFQKSSWPNLFGWIIDLFKESPNTKPHEQTTHLYVPKYPVQPGDLNLAATLQYGLAKGVPQLQKFVNDFTRQVYKPAYEDYVNLVHSGNTDGWFKCLQTLCNPGDGVLVSEWTYPSTIAAMAPYDIKPVPVSMDSQGMSAEGLKQVLAEWDVSMRGMPRPHVLYIVPIGQNPTGATMGRARKQEIYDVCVEFDVIIVEDDPYYFLQHVPYVPVDRRLSTTSSSSQKDNMAGFISELAPSFLRQAETTTQAPCGYSQAMTTALLLDWKNEGYIRWLRGLSLQYQRRRDFLIDTISEVFHLIPEYESVATKVNEKVLARPMFSFVPPSSGMYIWMHLHLENRLRDEDAEEDEERLEMRLWLDLAKAGVVFSPGWMFSARRGGEDELGSGHFRSTLTLMDDKYPEMKKAVEIFATVLGKFF